MATGLGGNERQTELLAVARGDLGRRRVVAILQARGAAPVGVADRNGDGCRARVELLLVPELEHRARTLLNFGGCCV